jgi:5-methylcytosine-specific restriction protein A
MGLLGWLERRHRPKNRPTSNERGYDRAWQRLRAWKLREEPLCRHCRKRGRITPATQVDHILPLRRGGTNDTSNLQSLCHSCHSRKTAAENGTANRSPRP